MRKFLKKYKNASFVNINNYRINKWMVDAEGLYETNYESDYVFEAIKRIDEKSKSYIFMKYPPTIKVIDKESNEDVVWDISEFNNFKYSEDQIKKL